MKRTVGTLLWLLAAWYGGSLACALMGIPDLLGPTFGISTALVVGLDPRHAIWQPRASSAVTPARS